MNCPELALQWVVTHSASNTEIAALSNVCRRWRTIVGRTLLDQAKESLLCDADTSSLLLLSSMIRFIHCDQKVTVNRIESYCLAWFHPRGIQFKELPIHQADESDEDEGVNVRDHRSRSRSPQPFAPGGQQSYMGSDNEAKFSRRRSKSPTPLLAAVGKGLRRLETNQDDFVNCMYQWNGYREAIEVLEPFGYAKSFVQVRKIHRASPSQNIANPYL